MACLMHTEGMAQEASSSALFEEAVESQGPLF